MTRNRKAELQRKLAMAPVATPPSGLAGRIKNEIPHFEPERERAHLRQSVSFNLRIAASIILLTSSLYFAISLFSRAKNANAGAMKDERMSAPIARPTIVALPVLPPQPGSGRVAQTPADQPVLPGAPPPRIASALSDSRLNEKKREESSQMGTGASTFVDSVERPAIPASEPNAIANAAPQQLPAVEHEFAPERAESGTASAKTMAAPLAAAVQPPSLPLVAAGAAAPSRERDASPRNFVAIQESIANGETPRYVDIAAIVHHFSAPERAVSALHVELEASAAPLDATKWLLRVSIDAPASPQRQIILTFGDALLAHRAISGAPAPNETALYEIEFNPNASRDQMIATVRAGDVERILRVADLHKWNAATPRMKRASLAAAWGHTLQSRTRADAIVAKAREAHFDELADLAEKAEQNR